MVGLGTAEMLLRLKNSDQRNYNIEMWRYSKLLKKKSSDPDLGHEHLRNAAATLQGVRIRINSFGMRGGEPDLSDTKRKRVMFLGSSMTLGWGVEEDKIMPSLIGQELKDQVQVFNAGIGNYNTHRYVTLFDRRLKGLKPDVVVVQYFIRDAEDLEAGGGNFILRHSQLAVAVYDLCQMAINVHKGGQGLVDHYRNVYAQDSVGLRKMKTAMARLQELSRQEHFSVILAMAPESHQIDPYPFQFVNDAVKQIARQYGWAYVDFTPRLRSVPAQDLWVMPGDPHYNALGHQIMAEALLPYLRSALTGKK